MISIDGITWDVPCRVVRTAELTSSEISGMLLNRQYFNDVLGTWMRYTVSIAVPRNRLDDYYDIYEILTAPVDGHTFILPYNAETITITGRVESVPDTLYKIKRRSQTPENYWADITFDITANHPTKYMSLGEVISMGLTPLPPNPSPTIGDLYEYTAAGWVRRYYEDVDEVYF